MDTIKVLLIEDEEIPRKQLSKVIRKEGFEVLLAENGRVGLDIEKIKPIDSADYCGVFHPAIREKILQAPDPIMEIYRYWTMLEAVVKAYGRGLFAPLSDIRISEGTAFLAGRKWVLYEIPVGQNTVCHCAAEAEKSRISSVKGSSRAVLRIEASGLSSIPDKLFIWMSVYYIRCIL